MEELFGAAVNLLMELIRCQEADGDTSCFIFCVPTAVITAVITASTVSADLRLADNAIM